MPYPAKGFTRHVDHQGVNAPIVRKGGIVTNQPDAYSSREIAIRVRDVGVVKAKLDVLTMFTLAVLAGAFIALGALFFVVTVTGPTAGYGFTRLMGGLAFSLGLILVVVAGAELFTGNNLVSMAWASHLISTRELIRNWVVVYLGNAVGAVATVALVWMANVHEFASGQIGETALAIAETKAALAIPEAIALGILCNSLVCLAVWLAMAGRTVTDKILGVIFPITAFVAIGFEHSIANMFFLPYGVMLDEFSRTSLITDSLVNLGAVTFGNIIGGTLLVAGVYWLAHLRRGDD